MRLYERCVRGFFNAILLLMLFFGGYVAGSIIYDGDPMSEALIVMGFTILAVCIASLFVRFVMFVSFGPAEPSLPPVIFPETHLHVHYPGEDKIRGENSSYWVIDDPEDHDRGEPHFDEYIDADFQEVNRAQRPQLTASRRDRILDGRGRR